MRRSDSRDLKCATGDGRRATGDAKRWYQRSDKKEKEIHERAPSSDANERLSRKTKQGRETGEDGTKRDLMEGGPPRNTRRSRREGFRTSQVGLAAVPGGSLPHDWRVDRDPLNRKVQVPF